MGEPRLLWLATGVLAAILFVATAAAAGAGFLYGLAIAAAWLGGSALFGTRLLLWSLGAKPLTGARETGLRAALAKFTGGTELPIPRLYILPWPQPAALSCGVRPGGSAILLTEGLLERLDHVEVLSVMARQVGHIRYGETAVGTMIAAIAGFPGMLLGLALRPRPDRWSPAARLVQAANLALLPLAALLWLLMRDEGGRKSDAYATAILGASSRLASALEKLAPDAAGDMPRAEAMPAAAPLFIVNPARAPWLSPLLWAHGPLAARRAELRDTAASRDSSNIRHRRFVI
jgi:heat shock protein HtpX